LWDTMEEFFSVVGYNGRGFPPFWYIMEEVYFHCGIQRKIFFSVVGYISKRRVLTTRSHGSILWDTMEKKIQCRMIF
jgi:hypothetical protein